MRNWGWGLLALVIAGLAPAAESGKAAVPGKPAAAEDKAAAEPAVAVVENAGYAYCVREANDAMTLARYVFASHSTREQVDADPDLSPYIRGMAGPLFEAMLTGRAQTHVHFAVERFKTCLKDQQVPLDVPDGVLFTCLSRVDIPFYFMALHRDGQSRQVAVAKVKDALAPWRHPGGLIEALVEPAYQADTAEDLASLQFFLINACVLPPDQIKSAYGIDMSAPGAAAKAPAGKAPAGKPQR